MSTSGPTLHLKLVSEMAHLQKGSDAEQQKRREQQRFFEEALQHDMDAFLSPRLQTEPRRPPIGSISSMEVNIDLLEQIDLLDLSDQEALDVFLSSGSDEDVLSSPLPDGGNNKELLLQVSNNYEPKSRMSSTSSSYTDPYSLDTSEDGLETPTVQSDEEDVNEDTFLLSSTPREGDQDAEKLL